MDFIIVGFLVLIVVILLGVINYLNDLTKLIRFFLMGSD